MFPKPVPALVRLRVEALRKDRHFPGGLFVAAALGNVNASLPGFTSGAHLVCAEVGLAEQLPRQRVIAIVLDRALQVRIGLSMLADIQVFAAEAEAQQHAVFAGSE